MTNQDKNNQNYARVVRGVKFPSERGVPERRGVFSERGGEHPVIASQCHPSTRGESADRGVSFPSRRGVAVGRGVLKWHELPFNPKLKQRARELRKAGNLSEVLFWNQIKNKKFLNLDFDRQKIVGNYIVDFYCKDLGAVVEIDGGSHDQKQGYDQERDAYLESFGLKIFHIQDIDIKKNLDGVLGFLRESLTPCSANGGTPLYERGITPRPAGTPLKEGN